jgi:hypothetical protein
MLVFIIIFNLFLTLLNLYIAIRLWQLRRVLARVTKTLNWVERRIHHICSKTPAIAIKGYKGTRTLRWQYQRLLLQLATVGKVSSVVGFGIAIWRRQSQRQRRLRSKGRWQIV